MRGFFPLHTHVWKLPERTSFRGISMSTAEMAVITGVVLRVYRALALSRSDEAGSLYLGGTFALGVILLFGMTTLHLGNYTVKHWLWRAPAFAVIEAIAESATSLGLIALHREPLGSARATFADWPGLARETFGWRVTAIALFTLLLAAVVQLVRYVLLKREHRGHTLEAVHHHVLEEKK
jgi:branched-subunit amino acid ABC-type transport system permease component